MKQLIKKHKNIKRIISGLSRKLYMNSLVEALGITVILIGASVLLIQLIGLMIPISDSARLYIYVIGIGVLIGIGMSMFNKPSYLQVIQIADSFDNQERLLTLQYFYDKEDSVSQLQKNDTLKHYEHQKVHKQYHIQWFNKTYLYGIALLIIGLILYMIPTDAKVEAESITQLQQLVSEELEKLDVKKLEALEALEALGAEERVKESVDQVFDDLKKALKDAKTEDEVVKALAIAKHELEKLKPETLKDKLEAMDLAENEALDEALKEMLNNLENQEDIEELLSALEEAMENMSPEEMKEALEALSQLAESLSDEALQEMLDALMKALSETGSLSEEQINQLLEALSEALSSALSSDATSETLESLQNAMSASSAAASSSSLAEMMAAASSSAQASGQAEGSTDAQASQGGSGTENSSNGEGNGSGEGTGEGSGEGSGTGSGSGSGSGQGSGTGEGEGPGSGAGSGSTNEDGGYTEDGGTVTNKPDSEAKEGEYVALYQPDRLGGSSDQTVVNGEMTDGGESTFKNAEGMPVEVGSMVSYDQISGQYFEKMSNNIDNMDIPLGMKELIIKYFSDLE